MYSVIIHTKMYHIQRCITFKDNHMTYTYELLEKLFNKRSELKYLINFRKKNQTRFYD